MKKLLAIAFLFPMLAIAADLTGPQLGVALNLPGNFTVDGDDADMKMGFGVDAMYNMTKQDLFDLGFGFTYQIPRGFDEDGADAKYNFCPIYVRGGYQMPSGDNIIEPNVRLGYDIIVGNDIDAVDTSGGLYWGIGVDFVMQQKFVLGLSYESYGGNAEYDDGYLSLDEDITYSSIVLRASIKL